MATSTQWQLAHDAAERYEKILVPTILGPAAKALVEQSDLKHGDTVVDVGCGTGAAARFAAEQVGSSGRVIGIDINASMLEVANSLSPVVGVELEWRQDNAEALSLADHTVDAALCAQTLQFLTNRPATLLEMYRVLKPSGYIGISLWSDLSQNPYFDTLIASISQHISPDTAAGLKAAFSLTKASEIHRLLQDTGFTHIEMSIYQLDLALPHLQDFVPKHISATPMAAGFNAASLDAQQSAIQTVEEQLAPYRTSNGVRVPFSTYIVKASR
jgi:ubiquinone/menaquinone biosynthesis C-methylase UbiE